MVPNYLLFCPVTIMHEQIGDGGGGGRPLKTKKSP